MSSPTAFCNSATGVSLRILLTWNLDDSYRSKWPAEVPDSRRRGASIGVIQQSSQILLLGESAAERKEPAARQARAGRAPAEKRAAPAAGRDPGAPQARVSA